MDIYVCCRIRCPGWSHSQPAFEGNIDDVLSMCAWVAVDHVLKASSLKRSGLCCIIVVVSRTEWGNNNGPFTVVVSRTVCNCLELNVFTIMWLAICHAWAQQGASTRSKPTCNSSKRKVTHWITNTICARRISSSYFTLCMTSRNYSKVNPFPVLIRWQAIWRQTR